MKKIIMILLTVLFALSCTRNRRNVKAAELNKIAADYVKLGLQIGMYDADFVDAYYGPDSLKPREAKLAVFPKYFFLSSVNILLNRLAGFQSGDKNDTLSIRSKWISGQLIAFKRRIKIFAGDHSSFDEESKDLFGVIAPAHPENYYRGLVSQLGALLPGTGNIPDRFQRMANKFIIPKDKIDTVFKTAIAASRKRTLAHYSLPANENFTLEYVTGKPWSGYNWYKGNYQSDIQVNTDLDIFIERAIDVASHESYPGHHVYNMLLEKNLYHDKGWLEVSLYPLFSPQSLIAEGSANYGIEVVFPGNEKIDNGIDLYFKILEIKNKLNFVRNEVGRGLVNKTMPEAEALRWLMEYSLSNRETALKSVSFIKKYESYVINYNYGQELVKNYIESGDAAKTATDIRWERFGKLLSSEVTVEELLRVQN